MPGGPIDRVFFIIIFIIRNFVISRLLPLFYYAKVVVSIHI
jgi:hypothetical protein